MGVGERVGVWEWVRGWGVGVGERGWSGCG